MTPMCPAGPKRSSLGPATKRPVAKPPRQPRSSGLAPSSSSIADEIRALAPAEVMDQMSGRQLEVFQMVMKRMERLEKENQELMQILIQMQGLLQQQQQQELMQIL